MEELYKKILLTGGIGDIIAIESFMSDKERHSIEEIYYATRAYKESIILFDKLSSLKVFPSLKNQTVLFENFNKETPCFYYLADTERFLKLPLTTWGIVDFGMGKVFSEIRRNFRKYNDSSFIKYNLSEISKYNLPSDYIVLHPATNAHKVSLPGRNFSINEINLVLNKLKDKKIVLIYQTFIPMQSDNLINLSGKLNILECIEVTKQAKGFVGVDSFLSVIASKCYSDITIKSKFGASHLMKHLDIYYAPNKKEEMEKKILLVEDISIAF